MDICLYVVVFFLLVLWPAFGVRDCSLGVLFQHYCTSLRASCAGARPGMLPECSRTTVPDPRGDKFNKILIAGRRKHIGLCSDKEETKTKNKQNTSKDNNTQIYAHIYIYIYIYIRIYKYIHKYRDGHTNGCWQKTKNKQQTTTKQQHTQQKTNICPNT